MKKDGKTPTFLQTLEALAMDTDKTILKCRLTPACPQLDAVSFQYPPVIRKN